MDINKIYNELIITHDKFWETLSHIGETDNFYRYNTNLLSIYSSISSNIQKVIGIQGGTKEEVKSQLSSIASTSLTSEQKKQLSEIRKHPVYKKMMGENALQMKAELENILKNKITSEGISVALENGGVMISVKDEATLWKEFEDNSEKIDELLSSGQITEEQATRYDTALNAIYTYYISQSKGEQIPFRKISDSEYEKIEEQAEYIGITPEEQLQKINQDLLFEFQEVQKAALNTTTSKKSR